MKSVLSGICENNLKDEIDSLNHVLNVVIVHIQEFNYLW